MFRYLVPAILVMLCSPAGAQDDNPGPRVQQRGSRVIAISRLFVDANCHPAPIKGRVIRRKFSPDEMMIDNVIIEAEDGSRELINIDAEEIRKAIPSWQGAIVQGLQSLLKDLKIFEMSRMSLTHWLN